MEGRFGHAIVTPFPVDPLDPLDPVDPVASSESVVFILRVDVFGLDGTAALCLFYFLRTPHTKHLLLRPFSDNLRE